MKPTTDRKNDSTVHRAYFRCAACSKLIEVCDDDGEIFDPCGCDASIEPAKRRPVIARSSRGKTTQVESPFTDAESIERLFELTGFEPGRRAPYSATFTGPLGDNSFARSLVLQAFAHRRRKLKHTHTRWVHVLVVRHLG